MIGYLKLWFPLYSEYMDLVPAVLRVYGFSSRYTPSIWIWFPLYSEYMDLVPSVLRVYGFDSHCTPEYMDLIPAVLPSI